MREKIFNGMMFLCLVGSTVCAPPDPAIHLTDDEDLATIKETSSSTVKKSTLPPPTLPPTTVATTCAGILKSLSVGRIPSPLPEGKITLDIATASPFDKTKLASWAEQAAKQLLAADCPFGQIFVTVSGEDDAILEATILLSDYELFSRQKISRAEWVRRLDIKSQATLGALKRNLVALRRKKDHAGALALVSTWLEQEPGNISARLIQANILMDQLQNFEALTLLDEVLMLAPQNLAALFNKAVIKKRLGSYADAIAIFRKLQQLMDAPGGSDAPYTRDLLLLHLAEACLDNNQKIEAGDVLSQVEDQSTIEWILLQSNLLRLKGKYADALTSLSRVIASGKARDTVYYNIVLLALDLHDLPTAEKNLKILRSLNRVMAQELEFLEPFRQSSRGGAASPATSTSIDEEDEDDN